MTSATKTALLTVREAAIELRCSPNTVYTRISEGRLRYVDIGAKGIRVSRKELDRFIEKNEV